jgi:hypothetical protein
MSRYYKKLIIPIRFRKLPYPVKSHELPELRKHGLMLTDYKEGKIELLM